MEVVVTRPAGPEAPGTHPARVYSAGRSLTALVTAVLLVGCTPSEAAPAPLVENTTPHGVSSASGPYSVADRGVRRQATPAPLPPMTCAPGSIVRAVDTGGVKLVAFGFDDGPWPVTTASIMTELERRGMRATFFMIGAHLTKYPDIGRSVVLRGHEVGNHTLSHRYTTNAIMREIVPAAGLIAATTGAYPRLFRSPGLSTSTTLQNALAYLSLCNIFMSISTGDSASPRPSSATICARFKSQLRPGAIVLAHDGGGYHESTAAAMPCMLDHATRHGYRVVTISELLGQSVVSGFGR